MVKEEGGQKCHEDNEDYCHLSWIFMKFFGIKCMELLVMEIEGNVWIQQIAIFILIRHIYQKQRVSSEKKEKSWEIFKVSKEG